MPSKSVLLAVGLPNNLTRGSTWIGSSCDNLDLKKVEGGCYHDLPGNYPEGMTKLNSAGGGHIAVASSTRLGKLWTDGTRCCDLCTVFRPQRLRRNYLCPEFLKFVKPCMNNRSPHDVNMSYACPLQKL